jgi:hypothetical protein
MQRAAFATEMSLLEVELAEEISTKVSSQAYCVLFQAQY